MVGTSEAHHFPTVNTATRYLQGGWWQLIGTKNTSLVGALEHFVFFYIYIYRYIGNHNPNWLSYFFQRGRYTTSQFLVKSMVKFAWLPTILLRRLRSSQVKKEEQWAEDDQWRQERLNHRQQKLGNQLGSQKHVGSCGQLVIQTWFLNEKLLAFGMYTLFSDKFMFVFIPILGLEDDPWWFSCFAHVSTTYLFA